MPLEQELALVRRIHALRKGGSTMAAIADALNRDRVRTKKGRRWAPATVHYVLRNDLYQPYLADNSAARASAPRRKL